MTKLFVNEGEGFGVESRPKSSDGREIVVTFFEKTDRKENQEGKEGKKDNRKKAKLRSKLVAESGGFGALRFSESSGSKEAIVGGKATREIEAVVAEVVGNSDKLRELKSLSWVGG